MRFGRSRMLSLFPAGVGLVAWILFECTNASGFFWGDAGEFAGMSAVLGIGHPYGHPLFWLMGRAAVLLQPGSPASAMNHLVAFCSALTCTVLAAAGLHLTETMKDTAARLMVIASAVLLVCSAEIFWSQASYAEVYNVQILFLSLSWLCFLHWLDGKRGVKGLYGTAFFLAVSVTLGQYALLFALSFLLVWRTSDRRPALNLSRILIAAVFFILGLTLWLYLPVRSSNSPPMQTQMIDSLPSLVRYLTRGDYLRRGVIGPAGIPYAFWTGLKWLFWAANGFGLLLAAFSLTGGKKRRAMGWTASIVILYAVFAVALPLNLNPIQFTGADVYFIPFLLLFFPLYVQGFRMIAARLEPSARPLLLLPPILCIVLHFGSVNANGKTMAKDYLTYLHECLPDSARIAAMSDETSFPLKYSVHALHNPKAFQLMGLATHDTTGMWEDLLKRGDLGFVSNHDPFFQQIEDFTAYRIAGPFFTLSRDSVRAAWMESEFQRRFHPSMEEVQRRHPVERIHLGILWAKHARFFVSRSIWYEQRDPERSRLDYAQGIRELYYAYECDAYTAFPAYYASNIALMMISARKLDDAERFARLSLKAFPLLPDAYHALYRIALARNRPAEALQFKVRYESLSGIRLPEDAS